MGYGLSSPWWTRKPTDSPTRISLLTTPLERQARKMDHISLGKRRLYPMMADPVGEMKSEAEYQEFKALVKKLKEDVEKESVDAKNRVGTLESISHANELRSLWHGDSP